MRVRATGTVTALAIALAGVIAHGAAAQGPVGADPQFNFPVTALPDACWQAPKGAACIGASVALLDQARAKLGQPRYVLPRNFVSLTAAQQAFVLTNLDRMLYRLAPIPGLTAGLDRAASAGVRAQTDPQPGNGWYAFTSNWAGGYPNIVLAYEGWMYDDGLGSGNLDCTANHRGGCWGHRHDILWRFDPHGALAMGAAAHTASGGRSGYAMLLEQARPGVRPVYTYRWRQAIGAGARG
jgi:hypothetical protein